MSEIYRRKQLEVAAVQWTGSNAEEMAKFLGSHFDQDEESGHVGVLTTRYSAWQHIEPGDWALIAPGGVISVLDGDEFTETYEAVDVDA